MTNAPLPPAGKLKSAFKQRLGRRSFFSGKQAETLAAWWLRLKGYRILARRWRCLYGEIDIIARAPGGVIAIAEVKARPDLRAAMEAVSPQQMQRLENAAEYWRGRQIHGDRLCLRFDIIAICPRQFPQHIKAAWTA